MNLYLINAATDAKRQVYLHMTEAQDLEFAKQKKSAPVERTLKFQFELESNSSFEKRREQKKSASSEADLKIRIWIRTE